MADSVSKHDSNASQHLEHDDGLYQNIRKELEHGAASMGIWQFARTAELHLSRFEAAVRRYQRALAHNDTLTAAYERDVQSALLYEALDTVFIVIQRLNLDALRLESSSDGAGVVGEDANFVCDLFQLLDRICSRVLSLAKLHKLELDFQKPVAEREGITYTKRGHWQDFVPGSPEKSFLAYFARAKHFIAERLDKVPRFWRRQTYRQALIKSKRPALREILQRLEKASFPQPTLDKLVEKETSQENLLASTVTTARSHTQSNARRPGSR